ncbi:MAG: hypothetical protein ABI610_12430 [Acidobacteriota bacterium]
MTESENTSAAASSSSGSDSAPARKRASGARRKAGTAARRKTSAGAKKTTTRRTTTTKRGRPEGPATRRRRASRATGLDAFLNDLAKRASQAGSKISDLSEEGTAAARRTLGKVSAGSKKTISRVKREWDGMNNTRKLEFVAGLLAALAAAGAVRKASRK